MVSLRMGKVRVVAILTALAVVLGCGGSSGLNSQPPNPVVAFINASPDSPALDAFLNNIQLANNIPYLSSAPRSGAVTTFASFEVGEYDVRVEPDGVPENGADPIVFQFNRDSNSMVVAFGLENDGGEFEKKLQTTTFSVDRTKPNGDKARLIIVNGLVGSPGFESPTIDFRNPGDNSIVNVPNIAYGGNNNTLIDSGAQTFVARLTGTEGDEGNITPDTTFTFGAGKFYAAIISGVEGEAGALSPRITFLEIQTK